MLQFIGVILAIIVFGGIVSGIVFFMTTIGWIIAAGFICLFLCACVVSLIGEGFSKICDKK